MTKATCAQSTQSPVFHAHRSQDVLGKNDMQIEVVIEIPKGTRNKYEADSSGAIWLDRLLFTSTRYPEDYGYIPRTVAEDGDPMDVMVLLDEPTFPGCHIHARPVGMFKMSDEKGVDTKVLCVPDSDQRWSGVRTLEDIPRHQRLEIAHFFQIYKDLEPDKATEPGGWGDREEAEHEIEIARRRFEDNA